MTREQFIEEIKAMGFYGIGAVDTDFVRDDGATADVYFNDVATLYDQCKNVGFKSIPYEAITVELINAVAGKEKP